MEVQVGHGTDLEAVARREISVTPIAMDLTDRAGLKTLKAAFAKDSTAKPAAKRPAGRPAAKRGSGRKA